MRTIITTVGISLLGKAKTDEPLDYLRRLSEESLKEASAETNSLMRLLQPKDRIVFLHSETEEGKKAAEALRDFYRGRNYDAEARKIPSLKYDEKQFAMRGLRSFVTQLVQCIQENRKHQREVIINATGGFKAEFAYAFLVGLLFEVPVYYIHEKFSEIISLPALPVDWNFQTIDDHESFFEWIEQDLRPTQEVENRLKGLPEAVRLLLVEEEGYTMLSPAGEAFYLAYRGLVDDEQRRKDVFLHKNARRVLERADENTKQGLHKRISKLGIPELRRQNSESKHNSDCLVYPTGNIPERIVYFTDEDERAWVCEIFASHNDYERRLDKGIYRKDYPEDEFEPFSE
jgi:putative CRISPR-associated protein (TIGR02619 family)